MGYPRYCLKHGHDHSGDSNGYMWWAHTEQCKNFKFWPFGRCTHMQTLEEAVLEANGGKWPKPPAPPPQAPPKEIIVRHIHEYRREK